jgi:hypothetical protein
VQLDTVQPSREYLGFLDELLECRDDDRFNLLKNQLQEVVHRESSRLPDVAPLIERYKRSVVTFHVHGFIRVPERVVKRTLRRSRMDFCATIQSRIASTAEPVGISNTLMLPNTGTGQIQASVFVDVRKMSKKSKGIVDGSHTVVRLDTLDECKRRIGNPRKTTTERIFVKRGSGVFRQSKQHGKLTVCLPVGVNGGNVRISLDQIE